ncbi:hypothetical protein CORC01_06991 [Colletotrichum orchidophilum]|uniref:Mitochondrial membrane protein n=1 Tax=Colletotrichum orchidophilum TaxID=1209926 RepID=A0A1G4B8Y1_9PEZI|nr:uncharacterized protein CORC01_06991 [Colletotrichum orchidophilum]OHE97786.1 hypothetical protein CORC01_06991 [Colletotrichum orchidophilum]
MLRANTQRLRRLGTSYICASCRPCLSAPCRTRPPLFQTTALVGDRSYAKKSSKATPASKDDAKPQNDAKSGNKAILEKEIEAKSSSDTKPESNAKPTAGRKAKPGKPPFKRLERRVRPQAESPSSKKPRTKNDKHTAKEEPEEPQLPPGPDVINQVFESLKKLEHSYASINDRLSHFQDGTTDVSAGGAKTSSGKKGELDAFVMKQKTKLGVRLKTISGTLDVLKSVLRSQQIPLDHLAKRPSTTESSQTPPSPSSKSRTHAHQSRELRVKVRKVLLGEERKPINEQPKKDGWTSLASRLSGGDKTPVVAAAAAAAAAGLSAANDRKSPTAKPKKPKKSEKPLVNVKRVRASTLELVPVHIPDAPEVPRLAYGLDRALFNPGVYHMQDPRSRVYNFDPYLSNIMPINEFDFNALQKYVTSSKDTTLIALAAKLGRKYSGSTSSMTQMLSHFHFLLSAWRPINPAMMSRQFTPEFSTFTAISRAPAAAFLHLNEGVYAIDADKEYDTASILSMLGKSMEKLLTLPKEEFEKYRRANSDQITEEERNAAEAFHYTTMGDFLMRSQLDAHDPRLPGSGMFDLKTRAVVTIRMDAQKFQKGLGYEIRRRFGQWESFEREYFDMIRSAFLKYSLQVRMGRMDGIFVAFHNTQRIFGFQYVSINEMDLAIHGTLNRSIGDQEFKLSLHLLNKVLDRATERFPGRSIRLHVETRPTDPPFMYVFAKPVTKEEIEKVQTSNQAAVAEFEEQILGMASEESSGPEVPEPKVEQPASQEEDEEAVSVDESSNQSWQTQAFWEEMQEKVNEAVEDDALGIGHVREAIHDALEQSALLKARTPEEARWYVDGLLEALTRNQASEAPDVDGKDSQSVETSASESSTAPVDSAQAGESSAGQQTEAIAGEETESVQETDEESSQNTEVRGSRDLGLKDLILRVASHVDEKVDVDETDISEDDAASDVSKLRTFERILSKLVAESKQSEAETTPSASETEEVVAESFEDFAASTSQTAASTESPGDSDPDGIAQDEEKPELDVVGDELLGMVLTVRNRVNGQYEQRPDPKIHNPHWMVEYSIEDLPANRAETIYRALQTRRRKVLADDQRGDRQETWYQLWQGKLEEMSNKGRDFRMWEDMKARESPVHVVDWDEPLTYEEAFKHKAQWKTLSWDGPLDEVREQQLREAELRKVEMREAELREIEMREAELQEAEMREVEMREDEHVDEPVDEPKKDEPRDS